jgi:hypothetical protein
MSTWFKIAGEYIKIAGEIGNADKSKLHWSLQQDVRGLATMIVTKVELL